MYLKYYGFKDEPFHITPDPVFFYSSPTHKEALASMVHGVEQRKGFIILTGGAGVGKTILVRTFWEYCIKKKIRTIYVLNPRMPSGVLMKMIHEELGLELHSEDTDKMLHRIYNFLIEEQGQGANLVLLVDEAQKMTSNMLQDLVLLSNLETSQGKLLQIILIGQSDLEAKLNLQAYGQIQQRIGARSSIAALTPSESQSYIQHRLIKAGITAGERTIFTRASMRLIVKKSQGIPRKINIICDNALSSGFIDRTKPVPLKVVKEVVSSLEGHPNRHTGKWIAACAFLVLFMGLAGFAMMHANDFTKMMKIMRFPIFMASHPNGGKENVGSASTPVMPELSKNIPVAQPAPTSVLVPGSSRPSSTAPSSEYLKISAGVTAGSDETVSSTGTASRNLIKEGKETDITVKDANGATPASSKPGSGKISGPAELVVRSMEKPMRVEETPAPAASTTSKPSAADEEDIPDPNKLMDWFMNRRAR